MPAKDARARLIRMIAVVVFIAASHSTIALFGGATSGTAADIAPDLTPRLLITTSSSVRHIATGESVTFNIRVAAAPASPGPAHDVVITDALPPEVDLVGRPVCTPGSGGAAVQCMYDIASRTVLARWATQNPAGVAAQVSFVVRANSSLRCWQNLENAAVLRWRKVPGGLSQEAQSSLILVGSRRGNKDCPTHLPGTSLLAAESRSLGAPPATSYYPDLGMSIDIPSLGMYRLGIVGVPLVDGTWDVDWLGDNTGWLEMTAMPGEYGNSVITAHVTDVYGRDGPFAQLSSLMVGEQVVLHTAGQLYTYQVKWAKEVAPDDLSVLDDAGAAQLRLLTLVTCSRPNFTTHAYDARLVVQAVMIGQTPEQ